MEDIAGFPNAVGAIDGSHISIKAPHINREDYFNRKQNYSINLQGVVDAGGTFIDVSTGWAWQRTFQSRKNPLELTDGQKIVREGDRKHMYIMGTCKFNKVTKCFSKFMTRCHLNKQS